ncbi:secernin-2 [Rhodnius prolixus]|uniref:Uncharacterized protein n=1 Tax=Rhodnius prolixus TaxID=13249 RepID=T1IAA4_RHOPR
MAAIPKGCDTFVVMPSLTSGGVVFGKNSDRPTGEVQEIVYYPEKTYSDGESVKCTYIEIEQAAKTQAVILSKPVWMWGAEMGANGCGVVIGNEAVFTKLEDCEEKKLLGMDLVRLGLERSCSASEALEVITNLLEKHGQGGPCNEDNSMTYHNSFLIADSVEAWVLETAGSLWVAQRITEGFCNISNNLTITTKIDKMSDAVKSYATENNLWNGEGEFNWAETFSQTGSCDRQQSGHGLLEKYTSSSTFSVADMFQILRDQDSGICMSLGSSTVTASSQVSLLFADRPCAHWFTGTPDPSVSVFKPFVFTPCVKISHHTVAQEGEREHSLYKLHNAAVSSKPSALEQLREMESSCTEETTTFIQNFTGDSVLSELDELFKDVVETEVKFYK